MTEDIPKIGCVNHDCDRCAMLDMEIKALEEKLAEARAQPEQDWEAVAADQAMTIAMLKAEKPAQRKPLPPQSPCEMTQAEGKMFKLGWLECEAAHGIKD